MFHYWISIITNQTKSKEMKKKIKRQEEKHLDSSINLLLNSKEIEYEYNTEIFSIEIKICSKTTVRSIKNKNLQQKLRKWAV